MTGYFTKTDLEELTNHLFPNGLSSHGKNYLLNQSLIVNSPEGVLPWTPHIPMIELILELVRRIYFPEKPSRFTTLFAWDTFEEAIKFQQQYGVGNICEVEAEEFFRGDMNLLFLGGSGIGALQFALMYWQGKSSGNPCWEYLLVLPVHIIDVIRYEN